MWNGGGWWAGSQQANQNREVSNLVCQLHISMGVNRTAGPLDFTRRSILPLFSTDIHVRVSRIALVLFMLMHIIVFRFFSQHYEVIGWGQSMRT